ncbi:mads box protein [Striga asiatica]|uniref:Mads box protein n=2 Tax=Orobanchaceae TaxID=91896 RepID=A0A5A7QV63_STRAF|nr:mads box protein [Striga asiatica]
MGRSKLPIKKIENTTNRQVTFSKRRYGLIKKAYEIAVLCDIDLTLIMLSPSGRLSHFSGRKRVEDVIYRYINLSDRDRGGNVPNRDQILSTLMKIKTEKDIAMQRVFEPDPEKFTSLEEFQSCEIRMVEALRRVTQRKRFLLSKVGQQSSYQDTIQQINTVVQYITEAQAANDPLLENDDDHGLDLSNVDHMNFGSDACSGTLRKGPSPTMYDSVSPTSGNNENAQSGEGCSNGHINENDAFQQFILYSNPKARLLSPRG